MLAYLVETGAIWPLLSIAGPGVLAVFVALAFLTRRGPTLQESWDIREREPVRNRILKAGVDAVSPIGNPQKYVNAIYSLGHAGAERAGNALVFRAKPGWRYGFIAGSVLVVYFMVNQGAETPVSWIYYLAIAGFMCWLGAFIWTFSIRIEDSVIHYMDMKFAHKSQDLAELIRAENFGDSYKLHFADGTSVFVPRYIEGHSTFKALVLEVLRINGR